jgi:hypothetical protein
MEFNLTAKDKHALKSLSRDLRDMFSMKKVEDDWKILQISKHPKKLCYPDKAYIEKHGLTRQGKHWEV